MFNLFKTMLLVLICGTILCVTYVIYYTGKIDTKTSINNLVWANLDINLDIDHEKKMSEITEDIYKSKILELKDEIANFKKVRVKRVKITFYSPALGGINCDKNPKKTALMQKPIAGLTCAISRDLIESGWLGKKIYIQGIGIRIATDIMGTHVNGKKIVSCIDILVGKRDIKKEARKLGKNIDILATLI